LRIFVVGLGNPGEIYRFTRHNAGALFIEFLAENYEIKLTPSKFDFFYGEKNGLYIIRLSSYMNLSGVPLLEAVRFFDINVREELIVAHDDIDLAKGRVKLRFNGGSGGHRGIESCIVSLGTHEFFRLKFGIGRPEAVTPREYVLQRFEDEELNLLKESFIIASRGLEIFFAGEKEKAMTFINSQGKI